REPPSFARRARERRRRAVDHFRHALDRGGRRRELLDHARSLWTCQGLCGLPPTVVVGNGSVVAVGAVVVGGLVVGTVVGAAVVAGAAMVAAVAGGVVTTAAPCRLPLPGATSVLP